MTAAKRPFRLEVKSTWPWLGVHNPDPMRDGSSPNSTVGLQSPEGPGLDKGSPQSKFAEGGLIGDVRRPATDQAAPVVTPLPSPGSALGRPQVFNKGGKVGKKGNKRRKAKPSDLGSGLAADAATDLTGRELQVENQIRAAEGLPPLKSKK